MTPMKWNDLSEEACPVARALSVIGDRWTLLVLRNILLGMRRFDMIQADLGITRHVLADRLKKLEAADLVERRPYQERPTRYEYRPTAAAKDFVPVMQVLISWANAYIPSDKPPPYTMVSRECRTPLAPKVIDENTGQEVAYSTVWAEFTGDKD
ncbi:helix-turn-helix domain-containing protein [Pelagimonas sp. KU-00592-HH]|uniref:winged helix-turn-helix transcriptional regulator n=1 Tax=Pelagimonas sp. KU-00592-HH TaxID=3127651 RepID=UPI00333EFA87